MVVPGPRGPDQSNTLVTHGAVESPLNSSFTANFFLLERESGRIQSVLEGLMPTPAVACPRSP